MKQLKDLTLPNEIWSLIDKTDGKYAISNLGRVASFYKPNTIILKPSANRRGYLSVILYFGGTEKTVMVHRLVALYFLDNPEQKLEVNHKDGIKPNNKADNLEWCTRGENCRHAVRSGLHRGFEKGHQVINRPKGSAVHTSVISEQIVRAIRLDRAAGLKHRELSEKYNLKMSTIRSALFCWKHLK